MAWTHRVWGAVLLAAALNAHAGDTVIDDKTLSVDGDGANWPAYGRNFSEQRYSPLEQVNVSTVKHLGVEWSLDLPTDRSLIATPLVVDGVLYFTGSYSVARAVDARTGKQ